MLLLAARLYKKGYIESLNLLNEKEDNSFELPEDKFISNINQQNENE